MDELSKPTWLGRGCHWSLSLYLLAAALLFGGVAGTWFATELTGGGMLFRMMQLATGSVVMGLAVAIPGSLLFGRNPIRWGMGMPVLVYLGGALTALVSGREGAMGLIFGAPLLLGCSIAAGVMGAFLIDGIFGRPERS